MGCKPATLNICAFCVNSTAVRDQNTTCVHYSHHEIHLHMDPIMLFTKPAFQYLKTKFPKISDSKIKEGIFVGPQINILMLDEHFKSIMDEDELATWHAF